MILFQKGMVPVAPASTSFIHMGEINIAADFPELLKVKTGWSFHIAANVTDNDNSRTNTGLTFSTGDDIYWTGDTWETQGSDVIDGGTF